MKQCKFLDKENHEVHGGIIDDEGNIICGCCGGLIEADEIGDDEDATHRILEVYDTWVDLSSEICGDDIDFDSGYGF